MAPTVNHPDEHFSGRVANVDFANGKAETDNEGSLAYFRRHEGYKISGGSRRSSSSQPEDKPLDKRTVKELQAYADEHGIDLGKATKKDDILEVIGAAEEQQDPDHPSDGDGDEDEDA